MKAVLAAGSILSCMLASPALGQFNYPPSEAPFFLSCVLSSFADGTTKEDHFEIGLYFPEGTKEEFPKLLIVDRQHRLAGGAFGFSMKSRDRWSLIDTKTIPTGAALMNTSMLTIVPAEKAAEDAEIGLIVRGEPKFGGGCIGLIGPDTKNAYETMLSAPSKVSR